MIPDFIDEPLAHSRILPDGIYGASPGQVKERFVTAFPQSMTRPRLFDGWQALRHLVRTLLPVEHEYLDGSFVTSKANPRDIDVSFWVRGDDVVTMKLRGVLHVISGGAS